MKAYNVEYTNAAIKHLRKLDKPIQSMIYDWIGKHLEGCSDPRAYGKALTGNLSGKWRYRVGDWRLIASIEDNRVIILVLDVAHRSEIYK
ncbi:MAG: type II toxin-antitoxin system RelE/ParE family toxin [Selenomonadaceae bacterium]|nr:type II toxin-antitoxin system RelE/ParE family toxin [Selenomonadaceae bacterium]